ncbi:MAG: hypothetical protein QN141_05135 [Armatimonadota bacterium]|nr:hypothetical protein [Armatimonadota bacterium]MDR7451298.1 hypothetical protein [Armatimonadota bacterium]MDR7466799.1 hypothetical protein [Armatimonadota bacterium]MDR7492728.1 hypothetical protein [Armatimonadota bacterium]MDR7498504.1 hypothetical protein [Armatimonadota bacterium]
MEIREALHVECRRQLLPLLADELDPGDGQPAPGKIEIGCCCSTTSCCGDFGGD